MKKKRAETGLEEMNLAIAIHLDEIRQVIVGTDYKLSLVARHVSNGDAHILVTDDDLTLIKDAIDALRGRPEVGMPAGFER
jgi:hypothetical protein